MSAWSAIDVSSIESLASGSHFVCKVHNLMAVLCLTVLLISCLASDKGEFNDVGLRPVCLVISATAGGASRWPAAPTLSCAADLRAWICEPDNGSRQILSGLRS